MTLAHSTPHIRPARGSDATQLAPLLAELGYPTNAAAIPARLDALARDGSLVLVATDDADQVLGIIAASKHAMLHANAPVAYITSLVTSSSARGQGVGRALVAEVRQWAEREGCVRLAVTSAERRVDAHAFYVACGLPYTGRRFSAQLRDD